MEADSIDSDDDIQLDTEDEHEINKREAARQPVGVVFEQHTYDDEKRPVNDTEEEDIEEEDDIKVVVHGCDGRNKVIEENVTSSVEQPGALDFLSPIAFFNNPELAWVTPNIVESIKTLEANQRASNVREKFKEWNKKNETIILEEIIIEPTSKPHEVPARSVDLSIDESKSTTGSTQANKKGQTTISTTFKPDSLAEKIAEVQANPVILTSPL